MIATNNNDDDIKSFNNIVSQSVDLSIAHVRNGILTGVCVRVPSLLQFILT